MTFPVRTVRFGPFDYKVVSLPADSEFDGQFCASTEEFRLRDKWASRQQAASTALHEILHGLYFLAGIKENTPEEDLVERLEVVAAIFIRDNQELMRWIIKSLR